MTVAEYNKCVSTHADALYRFVLKNLGDTDAAHDIVQDCFLKTWERIDEVRAETAKSYLFTMAYRATIDVFRRDKKHKDIDLINPDLFKHSPISSDLGDLLEEALKKLPATQRSLIMLRDYEGYSYEEIAQIAEISQDQVKVYLFRARASLKKYLVSIETVL